MKVEHHAVASLALGAGLFLRFQSWPLSLSAWLAGTLIDVDHLLDYVCDYGLPRSIGHVFSVCRRRALRRIFLLFHSWEWVLITWAVAGMTGWNPWVVGAAAGYSLHMLADQIVNRPYPFGYLLLWRAVHRFRIASVFPPLPARTGHAHAAHADPEDEKAS